ncbi:MAG: RNA exonuclease 3 [Geoglossum umbratile]|nr:MAG: RNA exonuclease 3 [Geoglossum umbratile]
MGRIMFSNLNLFSAVACPEARNCHLPHCLFSHSPSLQSVSLDDPAGSCEEPRKKRKKAAGDEKPLTTLERPVTPPPARVQVSTKKAAPRPRHQPPANKAKVKSVPVRVRKEAPKPVQAAREIKIEALNPRQVPKPPAQHSSRLLYVTALRDQYQRLNEEHIKTEGGPLYSAQELITMALDEEEKLAREKPLIYPNVIKHRFVALRKMSLVDWKKELSAKIAKAEKETSESVNGKAPEPPPTIVTGLSPLEEQKLLLSRLLAPLEKLRGYGFVTNPPTEKEIEDAKRGVEASEGWEQCDRCKTRFQVFPGRREQDGALTTGGTCTYHHGKALLPPRKRDDAVKGHVEKRWSCCDQPIGSSLGCTSAQSHVFKVAEVKRLASILQFERTPPNSSVSGTAAVCLDCEMCYTVHGLELVRMTATAWPSREEIIDVLVRPIGPILDLNSRFSGVWPEHVATAIPFDPTSGAPLPQEIRTDASVPKGTLIVPSPAAARSLLFRHLSPRTPLIGHALENDLNASRIIHPVVVDSAILFPHRGGLPYRNSLKNLMLRFLERDIQIGDGEKGGHDSKEDATAAGDLVRWKVGKEWKKMQIEGYIIKDGKFIPPKSKQALRAEQSVGTKRAGSEELEDEKMPVKKARMEVET